MRIATFVLTLIASCALHAQGFPDRPVRIIVPFPPGGSSDIVARTMANGATEALGQSVIVENLPGAGGNVGTARAAKAAPDGYTLAQCTIGTCSINGSLYANIGFDVQKDFAPVFLTGGVMNVLPSLILVKGKRVELLEEVKRALAEGVDAEIGADFYGSDAHGAVEKCNQLLH